MSLTAIPLFLFSVPTTSYNLSEVGATTPGITVTDIIHQVDRSLARTGNTVPSHAGKSANIIKDYFTKLN